MKKKLIDEDLKNNILYFLNENAGIANEYIFLDVLEDYQVIVIAITNPKMANQYHLSFKDIAEYLNNTVPQRLGDYSWYVSINDGKDKRCSHFGGSSDFPGEIM